MTEGIINVLKPPGMTSSNVVTDIKRLLQIKHVGHTGTLDPGAAGVLPVCLGRATRLFDILADKQKVYIAEIAFGTRTDTLDSYGSVVETDDKIIEATVLQSVLPHFLGRQQQIAPAYSALKSNGKAFYEIARNGGEIPERVREIEIHALDYIAQTAANRFLIRVNCSRGTYVRKLCEDIGRALHTAAHLSFLLRTAAGAFDIANAYTLPELQSLWEESRIGEAITPVEQVVAFLPAITFHDMLFVNKLRNGVCVECPEKAIGLYRIYGGGFLGLGAVDSGYLKLKLHF